MTTAMRPETWREELLSSRTQRRDTFMEIEQNGIVIVDMKRLFLNGGAVGLLKSATGGQLSFLHHVTKLETKDKTVRYVALVGLGSKATAIELDWKDCIQKVDVTIPGHHYGNSRNQLNSAEFSQSQKLQIVPPVLLEAMLNTNDMSPAALHALITRIFHEQRLENSEAATANGLLHFLSICGDGEQSRFLELEINPSSDEEVLHWSSKMHQHHLAEATAEKPAAKVKKQPRTWDQSFEALVAYKRAHGDCNVPREFKADTALGEWVKNVRANQKTLSAERRARLQELGFTFSHTQQDRSNKIWDSYYEKLKEHVELHGDCRPTQKSMQHWCSVQRQHAKRGCLSEEKKAKLDLIGFQWQLKATYKPRSSADDMRWKKGYTDLFHFHQTHGHINVPKRPQSNRPLWEFLYAQRKAYNEERLSEDKVRLLEGLGMVWDRNNGQALRDGQWDAKYAEAKAFRDCHGHLEVPRKGKWANANLLKWLARQREQYKNEKLPSSRIQLLSDLGFDWEGNLERRERELENMAWKEGYSDLLAYHEKNGTVFIPRDGLTEEQKRLEVWLAKQKLADRNQDLDPVRKALLVRLGVEFVDVSPMPPEGTCRASAALTEVQDNSSRRGGGGFLVEVLEGKPNGQSYQTHPDKKRRN